jgi:hypothetical protein
MLHEEEINKIKQLITQGKSNYRIWQLTGHSPNTVKGIREEMEKTGQEQIHGEERIVKNPTDITKGIIKEIDVLIEKKQLEDSQEKKWEKRTEKLREIIKVEVDDRIPKEIANAVLQRDEDWRRHIEPNYVKKEVVTNLKTTIQEKESTITNLRKENKEKDITHEKDQTTIFNLWDTQRNMRYQIQNLTSENIVLNNNYWQLIYYIENQLDTKVKQDQEQLRHEWEVFNAEKTRFTEYTKDHLAYINNLNTEVEQRRKAVEMREKQSTEQEEKIQKQENELEVSKNHWNKQYSEIIFTIKTRVEEIAYAHCEELVKRCFEKQINEINQQWKEIKDQQEQITKEQEMLKKTAEEQRTEGKRLQKLQILEKTQEKQNCTLIHPATCSGQPVVQSGLSN